MQVASVGLVKAIDRFDPDRGTAFSTFAVPTILGELKRYFRDAGWAAHVPRGMQERAMRLEQAVEALHRKLGRSPSTKEVAAELGQSEEEVLEALEAQSAYDAVSLEQQRSDDSDGGDTYADTLATEEESYELVEYEATIAPALKALPPRDRLILHLRFSEDMTQSEIAERIGVSQMHVSRLIRQALARLRAVAKATETRELDRSQRGATTRWSAKGGRRRGRVLPPLPAAGRVARGGGARPAAALPGRALLGAAAARLRRPGAPRWWWSAWRRRPTAATGRGASSRATAPATGCSPRCTGRGSRTSRSRSAATTGCG